MFFADLAGDERDERVADALAGLRGLCEQVRVLGSYIRAAATGRAEVAPERASAGAPAPSPRATERPGGRFGPSRRSAPLHSAADHGEHSPTRAGGVRVALRAPAART